MISPFRQNIEYMKACRRGENLLPSVNEAIDGQLAETAQNVQTLMDQLRDEGLKEVKELQELANLFSKIDPSHAALPLLQQIIASCEALKLLQGKKISEIADREGYIRSLTLALDDNRQKLETLNNELARVKPISPHEAFVVETGRRISERNHATRSYQPNYRK